MFFCAKMVSSNRCDQVLELGIYGKTFFIAKCNRNQILKYPPQPVNIHKEYFIDPIQCDDLIANFIGEDN